VTQLAEIHEILRSDAGRRRRTSVVDGLLVCAAAAVVGGFVYYALDRWLGLYRPARMFLGAVWVLPLLWLAWRKVVPRLFSGEDEIDVALRYQRRMGIDADLVAALQFETAARRNTDTYGSAELREAVIDQVDGLGLRIAEAEEPTDPRVVRRMQGLGLLLVAALLVIGVWHRNFVAFVQRVALADVAYPSNTTIESWTIDGRPPVLQTNGPDGDSRLHVTAPIGKPAIVEMRAADDIPAYAILQLVSESGTATSLELSPVETDQSMFRATLPAVVESARGRFVAGDAFSEEFQLDAKPLPVVTVELDVTQPDYAAGVELPKPPAGSLNVSVLEGSDVRLVVRCVNKPLSRVTVSIAGRETALVAVDEAKQEWGAGPMGADSGIGDLVDIRRQIDYQVRIEDEDGFEPAESPAGSIRLRPDLPPTVSAEVVTKWVLEKGKPSIAYDAADDLGIQGLAVSRQILRGDGSIANDRVEIPLASDWPQTKLSGKFQMPLDGLQLTKGDKVTIRLEARDRRADADRTVAQSEPFTLEVTDEQGLYEAMAETDQRSARKMDEIIQKQLMMTGRGSTGFAPLKPATPTGTSGSSATATPSSTGSPSGTGSPTGAAGPTGSAPGASPTPTADRPTGSPPESGPPGSNPPVTNRPDATTPSGGGAVGPPAATVPNLTPPASTRAAAPLTPTPPGTSGAKP
jgi:hypothetical protein